MISFKEKISNLSKKKMNKIKMVLHKAHRVSSSVKVNMPKIRIKWKNFKGAPELFQITIIQIIHNKWERGL